MTTSFNELPLSDAIKRNLELLGFTSMTPVQAESLPHSLAGKDVLAKAATGTGKTAAFGLALLQHVHPGSDRPSALVLCPTRELAAQVAEELRRLARALPNTKIVVICGGAVFAHQKDALRRGADIIVGTPGRVQDHLRRRTLDLRGVTCAVLDEADRMLEMGFQADVNAILEHIPAKRQTMMFSATFAEDVRALSLASLRDPVEVDVVPEVKESKIYQVALAVDGLPRGEAVLRALYRYRPENAVIFCGLRQTCDDAQKFLRSRGFIARTLHGGMEQKERDEVLLLFSNGSLQWLIATDVAARGIDIDNLAAVINWDMPREPETYTHRIGRTGRAGKEGLAMSVVDARDRKRRDVMNAMLSRAEFIDERELEPFEGRPPLAPMVTIAVYGGRKDKLRPGDFVGALTQEVGIPGDAIGPIRVGDTTTWIAVARELGPQVLRGLNNAPIKKRRYRATMLDERG